MVKNNKKDLFLEKLKNSYGIISTSCQSVGISRTAFYKWLKSDPVFAEKVKEINEAQIDRVEAYLLKKISEGDTTAIIFYLKSKGRLRGWNEHVTVDTTTGRSKIGFDDFRGLFNEDKVTKKDADVSIRVDVDPKLLKKTAVDDEETMILEAID